MRSERLPHRRLVAMGVAGLCMAAAFMWMPGGAAAGSGGCFPIGPDEFTACDLPVRSGSTVSFTFTISAPIQVSVVSYVRSNTAGSTFPQVLYEYDSSTGNLNPGTYTMSVQLPQLDTCSAQVDLVEGPALGPVLPSGNSYQIFDANGNPTGRSLVANAYVTGGSDCGIIKVNKATNPAGATQLFNFSGDLSGAIGDGGSIKLAEPAGTYTTTESVPSDWTLTSVTCTSAGATGGSTSVNGATTTYNLVAGELLDCTYLDAYTPPSVGQRTIGYWKNWSSCTNAKQAPVLDNTIAAAGGSVLVGKLNVNTCAIAVSILDKRDIATGTKMASDPGFNLAAQLLAADLNVIAHATTCSASTAAITSGQNLLATVGFTGTGATTMTATQASLANSLASTLDAYNNGKLC